MSLSIRCKFVVGFDGEEHRLLWDGVVVEWRRVRHVWKTYRGRLTGGSHARLGPVRPSLTIFSKESFPAS